MTEATCPRCGAETRIRLGAYECSSCNWMEQPAEAVTPLAKKDRRWSAKPPATADLAGQPWPMRAERWLLFAAFIAVYAGIFAYIIRSGGGLKLSTEQFGITMILFWPWCLSWYLAATIGPTVGGALSVCAVSAVQAVFLFTREISLKILAAVINALVVLSFALVTFLFLRGGMIITDLAWTLLLPLALGIWMMAFLIREIRARREQREGA
jgi:hypothetical protein